MARLIEYLRCHVTRRAARGSQNMKSLLIHNPGEPKICNQQICIVLRCPEEQILGFQIAVYYAVVVEVGHSGECRADEVSGVGFIIGTLAADPVEELAA